MGNVYIQSHWRSNDGCGFWVGSQFWHGAEQLPAHPSSMYVALQGSPLLNMDAYSTQMFRHSCCTVLLEMQCLHKCCTPSEVGCQKQRLNPSSELPGGSQHRILEGILGGGGHMVRPQTKEHILFGQRSEFLFLCNNNDLSDDGHFPMSLYT